MKIRGIVFSGFMSAILMSAVGMDASAVNLASKSYVDNALAQKQNTLTAGEGIDITDNVVKSTIDTSKFAMKDEIPGLSAFATDEELAQLRTTLEAAIAEKQDKGDYASAADLKSLQDAVSGLQSGGVDKTLVENLKTTVETISADYAKKTELTATEERLQAAIDAIVVPSLVGYAKLTDIPSLEGYAKTADVAATYATKESLADYAKASDLASKAETSEVNSLQQSVTNIENTYLTQEAAQNTYVTENEVTEQITQVVGTDTSGLKKQVADNTAALAGKADKSELTGLVTSDQLSALRSELEAEIADKQAKGDYVGADALKAVSDSLAELKNDSYTKKEIDDKIAAAISGGEIDLSGYATTSALDALQALVSGNTSEITALKNAGYQTSNDVQGAITTAVADLATDADLNTLQTTLEAAIADKQAKGDYLVAADLTTLNNAVEALQSGKADASTVATIQESISKLGNTYASKADMTAADQALQAAIDAINVPSLEGYVKAADLAAVATSGSYADLDDKPTIPSIEGLATSDELTTLQTTLEAAIADKQAKGDYLVAADLTTLNNAVSALQSGKADASTVATLQETVSKLGETYATDSELSSAIDGVEALIAAIKVPTKTSDLTNDSGYITENELSDYAKSADVADVYATKASLSDYATTTALAGKADKSELTGLVTSDQLSALRSELDAEIANKQAAGDYVGADALKAVSDSLAELKNDSYTKKEIDDKIATAISGGEIDLSGYATTSALEALQALVNGKQDKLTAGAGITITDNTISANVDTSSFISNPTLPTENGDYMLMVEYKNGETIYTWTNIEDYHPSNDLGGDFEL